VTHAEDLESQYRGGAVWKSPSMALSVVCFFDVQAYYDGSVGPRFVLLSDPRERGLLVSEHLVLHKEHLREILDTEGWEFVGFLDELIVQWGRR
jgi:hypothetical protein